MMRRLGSRQLTGWMRYAAEEPFGPEVESLRFGSVCAAVFEVLRAFAGGRGKPVSPADCALKFEPPRRQKRKKVEPVNLVQFARANGLEFVDLSQLRPTLGQHSQH